MSELDSLDGYFEISHSRESTPAEELAAAVEERNYPAAYSTLRRLDGLLSGWDARDCLTGALSCTPRLFGAILECCEPGEYAATDISVPYPERQDRQLLVSGTLLTLAAAMDRPEHMAILLEKGWDINSAAPTSEQALYDMYNPMMFQETGWRRPDSEIRCCAREGDDAETVPEWQILRATPLAAAIVAGSLGAVRLLRAHGGVKGTEHPAVSCAAAEAMHGTQRQRECLRLALGLRSRADDTDGMARELLANHAPAAEVVADFDTTEEFYLQPDGTEAEQWQRLSKKERAEFLREMWTQPIGAEECCKRLRLAGWDGGEELPLFSGEDTVDGITIGNFTAAACCGRNPKLLQALLESGTDPKKWARIERLESYVDWPNREFLHVVKGTMLCLAAAAGRTEQVRLLLDRGVDPNEDDVPDRSIHIIQVYEHLEVVTPLSMALQWGHPETASLLRERGAYSYPAVE